MLDVFETSLDEIADLNALQGSAFTLFTLTFKAMEAGVSDLVVTLQSASTAEAANLPATGISRTPVSV